MSLRVHDSLTDHVRLFFTFSRRTGSVVKRPAFRLEVVDCSGSGGMRHGGSGTGVGGGGRKSSFVVLEKNFHATTTKPEEEQGFDGDTGSGGNRWVRRRHRKMGTARFFDDRRARLQAVDTGKTIQ